MIPSLLPFMILSGVMIKMSLTEKFILFLYPIIKPLFRISKNVCYVMFMGFLCGFPMGAKTIAQMFSHEKITGREATFLLAFCNNIGPVYFCSFVLPLLNIPLRNAGPYLFGMYGLPFLYGLFLRYTRFRDLSPNTGFSAISIKSHGIPNATAAKPLGLLNAIDAAIQTALDSILTLGGYMILFNVLNLPVHIALGRRPVLLAPFLEITGGLQILGASYPFLSLILLPFGGLCCIAQTNSCMKSTGLSIKTYILHKLILTGLTALYYTGWCFLTSHF
ncbi:MAG: hypothetical protein E7286_02785 [Lachnospiraceae bacterium]|nr:hypothetical protein [Lachnospiraceae bacterium]